MPYIVKLLANLTVKCYFQINARDCYVCDMQTRSRSSQSESYKQRDLCLKLFQYLYPFSCMSPDVTAILSRMQNIFLKPVQPVCGVITCVFYFMAALV